MSPALLPRTPLFNVRTAPPFLSPGLGVSEGADSRRRVLTSERAISDASGDSFERAHAPRPLYFYGHLSPIRRSLRYGVCLDLPSKGERIQEVLHKLKQLPLPTNAMLAYQQLALLVDEVEDGFFGVESWQPPRSNN